MPLVPIEMPSDTVMVPKVWGMTPASLRLAAAASARTARLALQGVRSEWLWATPQMGLAKSPSPKPTARSIERFGARASPSVISPLRVFPGWAT